MVQLRNISKNRPEGMVIDVEEKEVKRLLSTGDFVRVMSIIKPSPKKIKIKEVRYGSDNIKSPKRL